MKTHCDRYTQSGDKTDIIQKLSGHEVFAGLGDHQIARIAGFTFPERLHEGDMIIEDSTLGKDLYIILSGRISVHLESIIPNTTVVLASLGPGEILGEFSIIDSSPRSASACCVEDAEILVIDGENLNKLFEHDNHAGYVIIRNLAKIVCRRIRNMNRLLLTTLKRRVP